MTDKSDNQPIRWNDAVRRRFPELSPAAVAKVSFEIDKFSKAVVADGFDLVGMRVADDGSVEWRTLQLRPKDEQ